ncbi:glycosyltransferase family 4 protein [Gulosibacter sp. 10]|uniref:glycosyltransferase family 4 protein n=1 Tax=Gulosibacter sp. 10 TaxID=1255570 RepID=UPI000B353E1D|nr:glycosyltransferase family 4 protein [Gulosibacter sp. 10]
MRILLLTHYFAPETGAPQRRWGAFVREFSEAGHEIAVMCPPPHHPEGRVPKQYRASLRPGSSQRERQRVRVFRVGYLPHRGDIVTRTMDHLVSSCSSIRRARKVARQGIFRPDVVIATAPAVPTLLAGQRLARYFAVPFIAEMRDAWPDLVTHVGGATGGSLKSSIKELIHKGVSRLQRSADAVVTTTESFADVLRHRGVATVEVIRNGAYPNVFAQLPAITDDHADLRVLYMGTVGRSQGLDVVVRAVHRLREEGFSISARIIGSGHERNELIELNERLGNPVDIRGPVSAAEVVDHYAWADSTIVSLKDWEPFAWTVPSKLYELLATGRHVTAVLAGEGADIVRETGGGDVVHPGDAEGLVRLWSALIEDRSRLLVGNSGKEWVRQHVLFRGLAGTYLEMLESVVENNPAGRRDVNSSP